MKKITKQHSASKMMDELSQLKIYGNYSVIRDWRTTGASAAFRYRG